MKWLCEIAILFVKCQSTLVYVIQVVDYRENKRFFFFPLFLENTKYFNTYGEIDEKLYSPLVDHVTCPPFH